MSLECNTIPQPNDLLNFGDLDPSDDNYAIAVVDRLLRSAVANGASDVHITQLQRLVVLRWRINGRLLELGTVQDGKTCSILGRLKALAKLITYRSDIPQEGRLTLSDGKHPTQTIEARIGTLPVLHGERAVIRLSIAKGLDWLPAQLGLTDAVLQRLSTTLSATSGVILITGTAGAGKTTTAYACLRSIRLSPKTRSVVSLEDPIESEISGVDQSQIEIANGYDWSKGLKALLRQDPEVMLIGEIRDAETATVVFQAAMTGQLVISTMHARSAGDAIRRLLDMGVPSHHLRSALDLLLCQRLLPKPCPCLAQAENQSERCRECGGTGQAGRLLVAEMLPPLEGELARMILQDADSTEINRAAEASGMTRLAWLTAAAVENTQN